MPGPIQPPGAYLQGELPVAELEAIATHLEACSLCELAAQALDGISDPVIDVLRRPSGPLHDTSPKQGSRADDTPVCLSPKDHATQLPPRANVPRRFGGYALLEEVGRGGMGVVYKAWDVALQRFVALKVVRAGAHASADEMIRFRREAELLARLSHPNLLQIHEIGQHEEMPFLVLEYVPGGSLDRRLAGQPQVAGVAAELVATLAVAVHTAHQAGVIHRDLKPANVLLAGGSDLPVSHCTPKVSDFGLAKSFGGTVGGTASNVVTGTPGYMAPEQASASGAVGPAADVYALGAILYECLTGRPPFRAETTYETLRQVLQEEPVSPRTLQPRLPLDLVTVCLKCLDKDPGRRYASAQHLAEDLRRFQSGRPVLARRVMALERAVKWARRAPAMAGMIGGIVALATVGFALVIWLWGRAEDRAEAATVALESAAIARHQAVRNEKREKAARLETDQLAAGLVIDQGAALCDQGDIGPGLLTLAEGLVRANHAGATRQERLARLQLAAWQHQLIRPIASLHHARNVVAVAFSPDGQLVATGSRDGVVQLWNAANGLAIGPPLRHSLPAFSVAFSPDSQLLLTGSGPEGKGAGSVCLWDVATGKQTSPSLPQPACVLAVAFSPSGDHFLACSPTQVQVWQTATKQAVGTPFRHRGSVWAALFSPDSKLVLTGGAGPAFCLWDVATGKSRAESKDSSSLVLCVAFSPDGKRFVTGGSDGKAKFWDTASASQVGHPMHHHGPVRAVAFGAGGSVLATGCALMEIDYEKKVTFGGGGEARLWDLDGNPLGRPLSHPAPVWSVAVARGERILATGCEDGHARVFLAETGTQVGRPLPDTGTVRQVVFSPDESRLLGTGDGGDTANGASAGLWRLPNNLGEGHLPLQRRNTAVHRLGFSNDGQVLLAGYRDRDSSRALLLDVKSGWPPLVSMDHPGTVCGVALSPDGQKMATSCQDGLLRLYDRATGRTVWCSLPKGGTGPVAFSSDGRFLASSQASGVRLWRVSDGRPEGDVLEHSADLWKLHFSADGKSLWSVASDNVLRQWDLETAMLVRSSPFGGEKLRVDAFAFQPEGQALLTASAAGRQMQMRNLFTGLPEGPVLAHPTSRIDCLALSSVGRLALSGGERTLLLWDMGTGRRIGPALKHYGYIHTVAIQPEAKVFAVGGDALLQIYDVPDPLGGSVEVVRLWAELLTGQRRDAVGVVYNLTVDETRARWDLLRERGGLPPGGEPPATFAGPG